MKHRLCRVSTAVLVSVLALLPVPRVGAQEVAIGGRSARESRTRVDELLARLVSVHVTRVSLRRAIEAVGTSADIQISFDRSVVERYATPVTLDVTKAPLGTVFERVLAGTNLKVIGLPGDKLAIVQNEPQMRSAEQRVKGSVSGRVTDVSTKRPISDAAVTVDGTKSVTRTDENGMFRVAGLSAGTYRVLVRRIGYQAYSTPVTIKEDSTVTLTVALAPSATVLNDVVTTATGDRKRYEVGNAVGTIRADSIVATTLIRNVSDLLQARVPGVVVTSTDGSVGAPSKIRVRGVGSINLNNDPIVIIDGVRMNAQTTVAGLQANVGSPNTVGQLSVITSGGYVAPLAPSRLDDLDPNIIESIDVLRGPSASSLYGTDAANGVIVIKTKRGQTGPWRMTASGDAGQSSIPGAFPDIWRGWGTVNGEADVWYCGLAAGSFVGSMGGGSCLLDSVTHFNAQNYGPMKTLGTGTNRSLSGTLSGGAGSLQQFFSARVASDVGVAKMSDVEKHVIARLWNAPAPDWMVRPNTQQNVDGSSRTTVTVSPTLDLSLSINGIYRNVLNGGSGLQGANNSGITISPADSLSYLPSESQRTKSTSTETRGTAAATINARPLSWLSLTGTGGGDYGLRSDQSDLDAQLCTPYFQTINSTTPACPSGHSISRGNTFITTVNGGANLSFEPFTWLNLRTAIGEQYSHTQYYNMQVGSNIGQNCQLAFGTTLLSPNPVCANNTTQQYRVLESRDEAATAGVYLEQTINAFGVYTTVGMRRDFASAFGGQVSKSPPSYPKFQFSYPLSDQAFFPKQPYVSSLRLRLAYGQSGNQASRAAVVNQYNQKNLTFPNVATSTQFIGLGAVGNPLLRPEIGTEWEGGFDVSFFNNERLHLELNLYRKLTHNMLTQVQLAPSLGGFNQYANLGDVVNRGIELGITTKLIDRRALSWDLTINGSKNSNKLVHANAGFNTSGPLNTQFREGYPLYGYWGVPIASYADANGDGILEQNEIIFGTQEYMGAPYPKGEIVYGSTLSLWNGALRLSANLDQIVGQTTQLMIDNSTFIPRAAVDRTAPLADQAAYIQAVTNNNSYLGTSSTVRLNELSATYLLPTKIVRRLHATSLALTIAGRNVGLWSNYEGKDPQIDTSGLLSEASMDNGLGVPQPRSWTLRFTLGL